MAYVTPSGTSGPSRRPAANVASKLAREDEKVESESEQVKVLAELSELRQEISRLSALIEGAETADQTER